MGYRTQQERDRDYREAQQYRQTPEYKAARAKEEARMQLSEKIVMMVAKKIEDELIRPGPCAEERECYEMAAELRLMIPSLATLVEKILEVELP